MKCRNSSKPTLNHLTFSTMLPNSEICIFTSIEDLFLFQFKVKDTTCLCNGQWLT